VRIVHVEALNLAAMFPLAWRGVHGAFELVAVRSLFTDGRGHPAGSLRDARALPLLLRAYPFVLAAGLDADGRPEDDRLTMTLEDTLADRPTDAGSPVVAEDDRLGEGTEQRSRALAVFAEALPLTRLIAQRLAEQQALVPWALAAAVDDSLMPHDQLYVIDAKAFQTSALRTIVAESGTAAALLLAAHKLSLFRAGILVNAAKRVLHGAVPEAR
jgi:hypothetical protein